jgi:DNA repair protein RadC
MKYCTRTITWRFSETSEDLPELTGKKRAVIRTPEDLVSNYSNLFRDQVHERFIVFWLSSSNSVMGFEVVSEGILNSSLVHPREVFRGAIVATCASIIVAHNHPSGSKEPSQEDVSITRQIVETGKIIGIPVHDHIIFAGHSFTSFAERGLL